MSRGSGPILVCLLAAAAAAAQAAPRAVTFEDGRVLEVEAAEQSDGMALLTLDGGHRISVPVARIADWGQPAVAAPAEAHPPAPPLALAEAWRAAAGGYAELIAAAAARYGLDPALLAAMAEVESNFDPAAVSHKGACGLMQLMPATARRFGVRDVFDAGENVDGGARYLSWLLERYSGRTELALAGYNAGEGAVDRHGGVPPYPETRRYVEQVLRGTSRLGGALAP